MKPHPSESCKPFEVYEVEGKFYYVAGWKEPVIFGPFDTEDEAEWDSTQAEACWDE